MQTPQALTPGQNIQYYRHLEKIAANSLILQATAYLGGHYIVLLVGSTMLQPLSLAVAGATYIFTRQSLFYLLERGGAELFKYKTAKNIIKLIVSLNAFCVAVTACVLLTPIAVKALLITNLTLATLGVLTIWFSRFKQSANLTLVKTQQN